MEDIVVTKLWMLGVIFVMLAYGVFAIIGISRKDKDSDNSK